MKRGDVYKYYNEMIYDLPKNNCRHAVINIEVNTDKGRPTSKLVFISLNPNTASIWPKMIYSGSKEAIKTTINGVGIIINATGESRKGGTGTTEGEGIGLHEK